MPQQTRQPATALEAFCSTCPPVEDVTTLLTRLGFRLEFQMDQQRDHSGQLPPLPAQYHYTDDASTEAIFLAGRDSPLDGQPFPPHASRIWLYAGADAGAFRLAQTTLAMCWGFSWRVSSEQHAHEEVA